MLLKGKRAIVTGSSSGIGRSIAHSLAAQGCSVVVNARGSGGLQAIDQVVDEIRAKSGIAIGVPGPVDNPEFAEELVRRCVSEFGGIDILINNAAIFGAESIGPVTGCSLEVWRQTHAVNLDAIFFTSRIALPYMIEQKWGRIINAASFAGTGKMGGSAYSASKSALFGLSRAMAADYGPYGITVNVYNPEAATPMGNIDDKEIYHRMLRYWVNRGYRTEAEFNYFSELKGPDGVAPWVTYLASDKADYINGKVFAVEGRRVAMLADPDETRALYRDFANNGPWPLQELQQMAPLAFPLANAWPPRFGEDLAFWETG